tara:strand:+ start:1005 stop:1349 length:345 start_codon:yes stop_codon:yes gene_type:complete
MAKPRNEIWLKGRCVTKAVNPEHGMFPNSELFKMYPRIFTRDGYIITSTNLVDRSARLPNKLVDKEQWMYSHWVRDNYSPFNNIGGHLHPYIQRECVNVNIKALKEKLKHDRAW